MGRAATTGEGRSWGELRPRQACAWEEEKERAILLRPRFGRGRLARWLERRIGRKPLRLRLDDVGTFVWTRCDGERRVSTISEELRQEFGERIEPAEERLVLFLSALLRSGCVTVSAPGPDSGG